MAPVRDFLVCIGPELPSLRAKLASMIERHYGQRQIAEGFFNEPIEDWWEPWMKHADEILKSSSTLSMKHCGVDIRRARHVGGWGRRLKSLSD
jgi:hypothetical protein